MANIFLAWQNRTDEGILAGGSWLSNLPITNLQNRQVQKVARSNGTGASATKFDIDLGSAKSIGVVALVVHNISVTGSVRITASDSVSFTTLYYDSGNVAVWPSGVIPQDLLEWEDDNFWLGTISPEARAGYNSPYIYRVEGNLSLRYWRVEIDDTSNSDGYVHIGRLFLSDVWQPTYGPRVGAALGMDDTSAIESSLGGSEYFDTRHRARVYRCDLQAMNSTEAYSRVLDLQNLLGIQGEILIDPDTADTANKPRRAFVGRMRSLSPVVESSPGLFDTSFEIRELI